MKSILMSIQPKWVKKIISGEKTIEVRKTAPKEVPFKVVMYETKFINHCWDCEFYSYEDVCFGRMKDVCTYGEKTRITSKSAKCWQGKYAGGKVIGEFVCDKVDTIPVDTEYFNAILKDSCLTMDEIINYCNGNDLKALHITALKLYDKPRELGEFLSLPKRCRAGCTEIDAMWMCPNCKMLSINRPITRPPQSWQYIETPDWAEEK